MALKYTPEMQAWADAYNAALKKGKSIAEAIKIANKARQDYIDAQAKLKMAAAIVPVAAVATGTATQIPQAFLTAFGEGGAAAATPIAAAASVVSAISAVAALGWVGYNVYNSFKVAAETETAVSRANELIRISQKQLAGGTLTQAELTWLHTEFPTVSPAVVAQPVPAPAPAKAPAPVAVPVVAPAPAPAPSEVPVVAPAVVPVPAPAKVTTTAPAGAPVTVNITTPTPVVNVSVPPIPEPLTIDGPLTSVQFAALIPALATQVATQNHQTGLGCMTTTGAQLLGNILKTLIPAGIAAGFMFSPALQNAFTSVAQKFVNAIYEPLTRQAPITPEKGPGIGATLLSQAVMFGAGAHVMSIMAEASSPLKNMGIGYLAAFMADAAGFSRIAGAYQGMMIQVGLSEPMKYWAQSHFRPHYPSERTLIELAGHATIDQGLFNKVMGYHGYADEWNARLYDLAYRAPSPFMLRYLAEAGLLPDDVLDEALREAQYNPLIKPYIKQVLHRLAAGELKGQFAGAVTSAYSKGLLEPSALDEHLDNLGYSDAQQTKAAYAAELMFATAIAEEMRAIYLQQHKTGLITDGELALNLSTAGYRSEKVQTDVVKAQAWYKPKAAKKVDPAIEKAYREAQTRYVQAYIAQYVKGYLDETGLYSALVGVGIDPGVARATVFLEQAKTAPKIAT